jgi:hypothetical protein
MFRSFVCAAVALVLCVGTTLAADKADRKKGQMAQGVIKKVDASTGTLTVTVKNKRESADKEFKVGDTTKITVVAGENKVELTGKDGLKNEQFKEGTPVAILTDESGKVTEVRIGTGRKKKENK